MSLETSLANNIADNCLGLKLKLTIPVIRLTLIVNRTLAVGFE